MRYAGDAQAKEVTMAATVRNVSVQERRNPEPLVQRTVRQSAYGPKVLGKKPPTPKKKGK